MPGLVPGIQSFQQEVVDGRDKRGHDQLTHPQQLLGVAAGKGGAGFIVEAFH